MPAAEPPVESPQLTRERVASLVAAAIILLALPALALVILDGPEAERRAKAIWFAAGAAGASVLPWLYWAPNRTPGFVPYAAVAWAAAAAHGAYWHEWPGWAHGLPLGLAVGARARGRRGPQQDWELAAYLGAVALGAGAAWMIRERGWPFHSAEWLVLAASVALAGWSAVKLFRPFFEVIIGVIGRGRTFARKIGSNQHAWLAMTRHGPVVGKSLKPGPAQRTRYISHSTGSSVSSKNERNSFTNDQPASTTDAASTSHSAAWKGQPRSRIIHAAPAPRATAPR
jgi:hypothetical protein